MKLRVGIVGLGEHWEGRHLPALRMLADRFEVRGICEQVSHRAERAAKELATAAVDGFRTLAGRDDIDAILFLAGQWFGATPIPMPVLPTDVLRVTACGPGFTRPVTSTSVLFAFLIVAFIAFEPVIR